MCGIVGAIAQRDVTSILIEGLRRLEYRGYDSTGIALAQPDGSLALWRTVGKVARLADKVAAAPRAGVLGIAHSRWATHGGVTEANAHPHVSQNRIALIHNGIIENYLEIREALLGKGYAFTSETDTEVITHLIHDFVKQGHDLTDAVKLAVKRLTGAYAILVFDAQQPDRIVVARIASPLVIGFGDGENFVASDVQALLPVTRKFVFLEEGDVADVRRDAVTVFDADGHVVQRKLHESSLSADAVERGDYAHYMLKEIHEQPQAIADTLEGRIANDRILPNIFGVDADALLQRVRHVQIVACGTSYHGGLVARYWCEALAGIPCNVEIASEFRYRDFVVPEDSLFVTISQSGETADTLAALREAKKRGYLGTFVVCNVPESSLVRESDLVLMTRAGPEVGVASTKANTTQLAALALLMLELARINGLPAERLRELVTELESLPRRVAEALKTEDQVRALAERFVPKQHTLFLGRGTHWPVALEGALKLKEISYIHAEGYAAGELKHGPLALVDTQMPVVAVAPNDHLLEKLKSNLAEVRARGGELFVFADERAEIGETYVSTKDGHGAVIKLDSGGNFIAPAVFTVPLQLLAYHVAVLRGTDVDQPRNLAKSVTVE
ncbi:MAG: glutamine--fructose-6-phosphate transaminase (isomerizing) [Rudaea sp.]|uniref:glutamine--fructose-6-phosphate transaminase (isomerizing) n=1 Tax=unclassified Rudaea TaxID=2627037 RepID=UPI0010F69891|nr:MULTISPECIES: glutamine--fructose-6-phosphate transaminase (isomerizing) [unclassified Rudaea]MBN8887132.1 glutamine--fructose-6-phosphate transaminase (isomerizing) [Rudaea sp.]